MNEFEEKIKKTREIAFKRRILISFLSIGLAILLSLFVFISRGIDIKISPDEAVANAKIQIVKGFGFAFGSKIYSLTSEFTIVVQSEGYKVYKKDFNLVFISETIEVLLEELPGILSIEIFPKHEKHTILINNRKIDNKDKIIIPDLVGNYRLSITNPFFLAFNEEIKIKAGDQKNIQVNLNRAEVTLGISTSPNDVSIYIDNELIGTSPLKKEFLSGEYHIRLKKDGYVTLEDNLEVLSNNKPNILKNYSLDLIPGKLNISSNPIDSEIFIDNNFIGKGQIEKILSQGNHNVSILKDGYYSINETILVPTNKTIEKKYKLKEMLGDVFFDSTPSSEIFIDGISYGFTPKKIKLRSIDKKIEFQKIGYRSYKSSVISDPAIEKKVISTLITNAQAKLNESKKIIKNSYGSSLKLFIPGRLKLGAPRSDPGQRANEVMRDVLLTKPFYIGLNVVTNSEYHEFNKKFKKDNLPVTSISWLEAIQYCNWLSKRENFEPVYLIRNGRYVGINKKADGYRLPTESEWTWVARYANQNPKKINRFAWGDNPKVKEGFGNLAGEEVKNMNINFIINYKDSYSKLSPVGSFRRSASGLFDLTGNVHEWMHDYYELLSFDVAKGIDEKDRIGPNFGSGHVIRGSSWRSSSLTELRLTYRENADSGLDDLGFRLARWIGE